MERVAVELGVHGDRGDAELAGGSDDTDGDLAPVGDQDLLQHGCQCTCGGRSRRERGDGPWPAGWTVEYVEVTGSTNTDLLATAADRPDRSVRATGHQTAGKGRLDRRWDAPPGTNLLVSILFHDVPEHPGELTRRVALAAVAACREVAGVDVVLKWPNDLLVGDAQARRHPRRAQRRRIGRRRDGPQRRVGAGGGGPPRRGVRPARRAAGAARRVRPRCRPTSATRYRAALGTLGRGVRVELPDGVVEGTATDVEPDGRLVLLDTCGVTHRFAAGDVVHLRRV